MPKEYINDKLRIVSGYNYFVSKVKYTLEEKRYFLGFIPYWDQATDSSFHYQNGNIETKKELIDYLLTRYDKDLEEKRISNIDLLK